MANYLGNLPPLPMTANQPVNIPSENFLYGNQPQSS